MARPRGRKQKFPLSGACRTKFSPQRTWLPERFLQISQRMRSNMRASSATNPGEKIASNFANTHFCWETVLVSRPIRSPVCVRWMELAFGLLLFYPVAGSKSRSMGDPRAGYLCDLFDLCLGRLGTCSGNTSYVTNSIRSPLGHFREGTWPRDPSAYERRLLLLLTVSDRDGSLNPNWPGPSLLRPLVAGRILRH